MKLWIVFVLFIAIIPLTWTLYIEENLVLDFLNHLNLKYGIIFFCDGFSGNIKNLLRNGTKYMTAFDLSSDEFQLDNLEIIMKIDHRIIGVIFDLTCNETEDVFEEISRSEYFNASYNWLMIAEDYDESVELLKQQNINLDAEITIAVPDNSTSSLMLFDIYNPCHKNGGLLNITEKGHWNKKEGFKVTLTQHKIYRRSNLNGITFEAGVVATEIPKHHSLLQYMESDENIQFDAQHRLSYKLFKLLSIQHNFSMNLHRSDLWGLYRNGTFSGVLGMIQQGKIDLSITPFRYTRERLDVLDFSVVTWVTTKTIVFRHPQTGLRNIFLQPLDPQVWFSILSLLVFVSILLMISIRIGCKNEIPTDKSYFNALVTTLGILCQQGFFEQIKKLSTRLIFLVFVLFSILIYQFYSCFIVGSLLTRAPKTINTIKQLIDSNLHVGIEDISYNLDFFQLTTDEVALELFKRKVVANGKPLTENFYSVLNGVKKLKKGGFAFHVDVSYAYRTIHELLSETEICELHEMLLFPIRPLAVGLPKGSPLKELITVGLQRLVESGMLDYYSRRWYSLKPKCVKSKTEVKAVDLTQASSIFIAIFMGILLSLIVLVFEILNYKIKEALRMRRKLRKSVKKLFK